MTIIRIKLNGAYKEYDGGPARSLLRRLREDAGVISPEDGCSPQAACGFMNTVNGMRDEGNAKISGRAERLKHGR